MKSTRSFAELNLAIIFLSTSGVLGRSMEMSPTLIIWWRCAIAVVIMYAFIKLTRLEFNIKEKSHYFIIFLSAFLLAAHWVMYFYSLSLSSIAIAMLTLHAYPTMTALLEPVILKTKFKFYHLILALLIIIGVYIILPPIGESPHLVSAIILGLASALAYSLRNIFTRKVIVDYHGSVMMFFQLLSMTFLLLPFLFLESNASLKTDLPFLLTLAIVATSLGHTLFVRNLKTYNTTTISLLTSIVPVYGILWGVLFLDEIPSSKTVLGGSLILLAFLIESRKSA